jgi:hypothetical protein
LKTKTKATLAIILTAILSATVTYAVFLLAYPITTTIVIKPAVSMGVFDTDGVTPLTDIDMGQCERNRGKFFPGGVIKQFGEPYVPEQFYYINNTDEQSFYVAFAWSDLPPGSPSMDVWIKRGDQTTFTPISTSGTTIYNQPIMTHLDDPDPAKQYAVWYFRFDVGAITPFGTYTPTLTINVYSTATG